MNVNLTCSLFFDGEQLHGPRQLVIENNVVVAISPFEGAPDFHVLSPGLVDIQMNGYDQWDVSVASASDFQLLDNALANAGTTTWLATIVTAPLARLSESVNRISQAMNSVPNIGCVGVHIEGPFLGDAPGAHNPEWIIPIDEKWIEELPATVRLVTVGAEQPHVAHAVEAMRSRNIAVSVGHSRPSRSQFDQCVAAGASLVTHLYNGMSGVHHRDDGLALMALTTEGVRVGLIADLVHCSAPAVNLAFRAKSDDEIVLVSDSVAWNSKWAHARSVEIRSGAPRLPNGTLAGSSTPLGVAVAHAVNHCGVDLSRALRAATSNPADAVQLTSVGRIRLGQPADVVAFDSSLSVVGTWRRLPSVRA